ncbi:hypothetical protein LNQ03_08340 [Klebsiella pneumoniae subsp. pneumoniae]|nr:hypothetical protein [Klebsiella pneumoniae subsp. pneumoniae]
MLIDATFADRVFFCNSWRRGESALSAWRKYAHHDALAAKAGASSPFERFTGGRCPPSSAGRISRGLFLDSGRPAARSSMPS